MGRRRHVRFENPLKPAALLTDLVRPAPGGVQVYEQLFGSVCTLSFNAIDANGELRGVTAAHCSPNVGINDGSVFGQPLFGITNEFGTEIFDPAYRTDLAGCPSGFACRWSDSLLITGSSSRNQRGAIARPAGIGSLTINSTSPSFRIMGESPRPLQNEQFNWVGRTSGWQQGVVTQVCQDLRPAGGSIYLLCQGRMTSVAQPGDSGAPVFSFPGGSQGTNVLLRGIVWGDDDVTTVFSPIQNIERDLGPLDTCASGYVNCQNPEFGVASCTSLAFDPNNCGYCGHDCQSGVCQSGSCAPVEPGCPPGYPYDCCGDGSACMAVRSKCDDIVCY